MINVPGKAMPFMIGFTPTADTSSMGDFERTQVGIGWDDTVRIVSSANGRIEWRLIPPEERCRRYNRDPCFGKWLLQPCARMPIDSAIRVRLHEDLIRELQVGDLGHVVVPVSVPKGCFLTTACRNPGFL
jgi:hypothetical protein